MNSLGENNRNQYARNAPCENLMAVITHLRLNTSLKTLYLFMYGRGSVYVWDTLIYPFSDDLSSDSFK